MAFKIFDIKRSNALLDAAAAAISPALVKAGISTVTVDGKAVAASEAPLADQIKALIAAAPVQADSQNAAEALVSNELIAKELETAQTSLAVKTTAVETLTKTNVSIQQRAETARKPAPATCFFRRWPRAPAVRFEPWPQPSASRSAAAR